MLALAVVAGAAAVGYLAARRFARWADLASAEVIAPHLEAIR